MTNVVELKARREARDLPNMDDDRMIEACHQINHSMTIVRDRGYTPEEISAAMRCRRVWLADGLGNQFRQVDGGNDQIQFSTNPAPTHRRIPDRSESASRACQGRRKLTNPPPKRATPPAGTEGALIFATYNKASK
jgi:hypothetical protein